MDLDEILKFSVYLPKYLTDAEKAKIVGELKAFPKEINYFLENPVEDWLQGDGWRGFVVINFSTTNKREVSGVIVSNSCDIDPANSNPPNRNIVFSPLIDLEKYLNLLKSHGKDLAQIENIKKTIIEQEVYDIFYLPRMNGVIGESILLLDDLHVHPLTDFSTKA